MPGNTSGMEGDKHYAATPVMRKEEQRLELRGRMKKIMRMQREGSVSAYHCADTLLKIHSLPLSFTHTHTRTHTAFMSQHLTQA